MCVYVCIYIYLLMEVIKPRFFFFSISSLVTCQSPFLSILLPSLLLLFKASAFSCTFSSTPSIYLSLLAVSSSNKEGLISSSNNDDDSFYSSSSSFAPLFTRTPVFSLELFLFPVISIYPDRARSECLLVIDTDSVQISDHQSSFYSISLSLVILGWWRRPWTWPPRPVAASRACFRQPSNQSNGPTVSSGKSVHSKGNSCQLLFPYILIKSLWSSRRFPSQILWI